MSKSTLRTGFKTTALAMALAALPLCADAAGLGRITVLSTIGQPLRAEVEVSASREEINSLAARVAPPEVFKRSGVEYASILTSVRFTVEKRADGQPYLSLRSDLPFNDPFLDLLVELNWASGRLVREYTFLLDPPESLQKPVGAQVQAAPVALPTVQPSPSTVPIAEADIRREAPVVAAAPAASSRKKPGVDMKVVRGSDGVQRIVKSGLEPATPAEGAETRTVKRGETLHRIAVETRPEGVSLDQMLVALFRGNKEAFDGGNINRLKSGQILSIPDREVAAAIDAAEAKQIVLAHSSNFNAYRRKLAGVTEAAAVPKETAPPSQSASGKITPKVEEKQPPATAGKDKLEISRTESNAAKTAAGRRAAAEEEKLAREKALKDANARIADLDKNINDLKKLAEVKNQNMAELQKQAQQPAKPASAAPVSPVAPAPAAKPASAPVSAPTPVATAPISSAKPDAPAKPVEAVPAAVPAPAPVAAPVPVEPAAAQPEKPAQAAQPAPAAKKKPIPPQEPPPPPSFIDDNPEIVFGGAGVLALLAGYLGFSFWRKKRKVREEGGGNGADNPTIPSINSVFGSTGGQVVDTGNSTSSSLQTDFSLAEVGANDSVEGVDPIKEADVYMAYGRNAQAEEILLDALKNEPERQAIHLKLLEIYAARKSPKQFETIALDLQKLTGSSGPNWERVQQLGQELDPENALYAAGNPEAAYDPAATMVMTHQELGGLDLNSQPEAAVAAEPAQMDKTLIIQPAAAAPKPAAEEDFPDSLDFELDLGAPVVGGAASAVPETGAAPKVAASGDLGFDLNLGGSDEPAKQEASPAAVSNEVDFDFDLGGGSPAPSSSPALEVPAAGRDDGNVIDFDLAGAAPAVPVTAKEADLSLPSIELDSHAAPTASAMDLSLDIPSITMPEPAAPTAFAAAEPVASALSVDLSSISLELDTGKKAEPAPLEMAPAASAAAPALAASGDDGGSPEVETKLELAQAYEEMGDKDGARELLQEVLNEGNARQQDAARGRLAKLG